MWKPGSAGPGLDRCGGNAGATPRASPRFGVSGRAFPPPWPVGADLATAGAWAPVCRSDETEGGFAVHNPFARHSIARQRRFLPIYQTSALLRAAMRRSNARRALKRGANTPRPRVAAGETFLYLMEHYRTLVIVGETGSGKSTRATRGFPPLGPKLTRWGAELTQYLHEAGWTAGGRRVACTQPRRVAASTVAARVAEEMGVELGQEVHVAPTPGGLASGPALIPPFLRAPQVGYTVRFDRKMSEERSRILYMTDGHLVRELMHDPLLRRYSAVILDEAHERGVETDLLMGLLKKVRRRRPDLRLVVSSATLQADAFKRFFETNPTGDTSRDTAVVLPVEGRQFPVDILYRDAPTPDYLQACVDTVLDIHAKEPRGDILVFLPGSEEIDSVVHAIQVRAGLPTPARTARDSPRDPPHCVFRPQERASGDQGAGSLTPLAMYSSLPYRDQLRVFQPVGRGRRKVVCATNIAETSVTIEGIVYVIDSMFVKLPMYNARTGCVVPRGALVAPCGAADAIPRQFGEPGRAARVAGERDPAGRARGPRPAGQVLPHVHGRGV